MTKRTEKDFSERRDQCDSNGHIEDWIKRQKDDPHDEMLPQHPMSRVADKDYEC